FYAKFRASRCAGAVVEPDSEMVRASRYAVGQVCFDHGKHGKHGKKREALYLAAGGLRVI
ncbi:MAG TPA: hypothetical protein VF402_03200, partial [Asticcacaulis sp.]